MSLGFHRDSFTMLSELAEREEKRLSFRTAATEIASAEAEDAASDSGSSFFTAATTGGLSDSEGGERWVDGIAVVTSPPAIPIPTPPDLGAAHDVGGHADDEDDDHTPPDRPTTGGFDYEGFEGYVDYHYDPYSISSSRAGGGGGKREGGNVFCCLFAPWMRKNRGSFDDSSDEGVSDSDSDLDHDEEDHAAVAASAEEEVGEHIVDTLAGDVTIFDAVDTSPSLEEKEKEKATVAVEERAPDKMPEGAAGKIQQHEEEKARPRGDDNSGDVSGGMGPGEKGEPKSTTSAGASSPSTPPRSDKDSGDGTTTPPHGSHAKRDSASMRQEILDETMRKVKEQHSPVERKLGILPPGGSAPTGVPFMLPSRLRKSPARGIIKRQRLSSTSSSTDGKEKTGPGAAGATAQTSSSGAAASSNAAADDRPKRRSLFPTASADGGEGAGGGGVDAAHPSAFLRRTQSARTMRRRKGVRFAPIAKVTTIVSRQDMNHIDRSRIWWSRSDYDAFKKTGRIIAKALLTGGSEIWLHSQNRRLGGGGDFNGGKDEGKDGDDEEEDYGDKWWCRFGHSRRGLEHIASAEEGRLRQKSVANAHRAVLMEQRKQQLMAQRRGGGDVGSHVTGVVDEKKLAVVCQQHTSWAKQLALSTGRADAEAVKMNFAEGGRRREHLVVRASLARGAVYESSLTKRSSWENQTPLSPDLLDANTSSAIFVRKIDQREHDKQEAAKRAQCASPAPSSASASSASSKSTTKPDVPDVESASEAASDSSGESGAGAGRTGHELLTDKDGGLYEMVHDPEEHESNISKEAASFGKGDDGVDLQSFLSRSVGVGAH